MNLYDLVKRRDRTTEFDANLVKACEVRVSDMVERCVLIAPKSVIRIQRAHEIVCLASAPQVIGWQIGVSGKGYAEIELSVRGIGVPERHSLLFHTKVAAGDSPKRVVLEWPTWTGDRNGYFLTVANHGDSEAFIAVGPHFSARPKLLSELCGSGVEVGPGANPCVKPTQTVTVKYVETLPVEEWALVYGKHSCDEHMMALWGKYVVASAHQLETFPDGSLDFIFSNHVFEHLVNPLGVLQNWHKKLRPNGIVAAVIPDARFTFDLRQPLSTIDECIEELNSGGFGLGKQHYERWCRYTAPYNTPDDLIQRRYSIHAKYYTPDSFKSMAEYSLRVLGWAGIFVQSTLNGKDFGVMLRKSISV